ncbi:PH domain-containing protein [Psychrobacillus sp. FSL K6-1267]|uniref:PH domain-containing protein n=1 Tax=Psychrobacillus sp. FSL K6-1267 TaxID=2921543 RepID=UPI0030FAB261
MSFWKKILGNEDLSSEKKDEVLRQQALKKRDKERINDENRKLQEKYLGTGFGTGFNYSLYKNTILYFEQVILMPDEYVLSSISAEYDKTKKREIKGLLVATNLRLVFVTRGIGFGEFFEEFNYKKINGISLAPDGFGQRELLIDYGRSRKVFDDITNNKRFTEFLTTVREKINEARQNSTLSAKKTVPKPSSKSNEDRYTQLEKIAQLRDQGILSQTEFNKEKEKILNS